MHGASRMKLTPIAQITCRRKNGSSKPNPKLTQVSSSAISHSPRVTRKLHQGRAALALLPLQEDRDAREQHEGRRAEMRDPAGGEQGDAPSWARSVGEKGVAGEEVAHMVEHHEDDDEPAQLVDDLEPGAWERPAAR